MCQHAAIIVCFVFSSLRRSVVLTAGACALTHPAGTMLNLRPAPGRTRFKTPNLGLIVKTVEYRVLGDCLQLLRSCLEAWVEGHLRPHLHSEAGYSSVGPQTATGRITLYFTIYYILHTVYCILYTIYDILYAKQNTLLYATRTTGHDDKRYHDLPPLVDFELFQDTTAKMLPHLQRRDQHAFSLYWRDSCVSTFGADRHKCIGAYRVNRTFRWMQTHRECVNDGR